MKTGWTRIVRHPAADPTQDTFGPHTPLPSSNLFSARYSASESTLEITFQTGSVWQYRGVPPSVWSGLLGAPSPGKYFHAWIKPTYPAEKQ